MTETAGLASVSPADYALDLRRLQVCTATGTPIVDDVSLHLRGGDILGLVGESGSGKTTTALSLFGYAQGGARITAGELDVAGRTVVSLSGSAGVRKLRGRSISYVPQSPGTALNPVMRVGRALEEMQRHRDRGRPTTADEWSAERRRALATVGLPGTDEFLKRFPHQLSGGQQQRVCLAVALLSGAPTIVLDEPTTGLDVITQASVLDELRRLQRERGVAMLYISHDLAVIAQLATHVAVMYAGRIVETGKVGDVLRAPSHPYTSGLLASTPDHRSAVAVQAMPGSIGALSERTDDACAFAPRCSRRTDECTTHEPPFATAMPGHAGQVRCFHPIEQPTVRSVVEPTVATNIEQLSTVLSVQGLSVRHRVRGVDVAAVNDVSFDLTRGCCLALVGESGSGKTTIARTVAGLQPFESGHVSLHGVELASAAAKRTTEQRRLIQLVFQNASQALNPRENVRAAIQRSLNLCRPESRRSLEELMELVRLPTSFADRLPRDLSGGERQRVAIARGLATSPEILICDEITSALDVSVQAAVITLLRDLRNELGLALLFITHDLGVVSNLADNVIVLRSGSVCERGDVRSVLDHPGSDYAQRLMEAAPTLVAAS